MLGFYKAETEHYHLILGFSWTKSTFVPPMLGFKGEKNIRVLQLCNHEHLHYKNFSRLFKA